MPMSTAIRDVSKLLSGNLLAKTFGLIALMLFARLLPKSQMAVFPVYLVLIGLPDTFVGLGILQTLVRRLPSLIREDAVRARSLVLTGSAILLAGCTLLCLLAAPFSDRIADYFFRDPAQAWIIQAFLIACVGAVCSKIADALLWGMGRFGAISLIQILESVIRPVMTVVLYFLFGLKGIVAGLVAAQTVMVAVSFFFVKDIFLGALPPLYPIRQLLRESFPFYVDNYLWYLKGEGDTLLVALLGPLALAEYYIAKNLYSNVVLIWTSIDRVALERLARLATSPAGFRDRIERLHTRISEFALPVVLSVIAVAPYGVIALASIRYTSATWPAVVLLFAALIQFAAIPVNRGVFVGLPGTYRLAVSGVEAVTVVATALCLVPIAGIMGIAVARAVGPAAGAVAAFIVLRRTFSMSLSWSSTLRSLAAAAPPTLLI